MAPENQNNDDQDQPAPQRQEDRRPGRPVPEAQVKDDLDIGLGNILGNPINEGAQPVRVNPDNGRPENGGQEEREARLPGGQRSREETVERVAAANIPENEDADSFLTSIFEAGAEDEIDDATAALLAGQPAPRAPNFVDNVGPERPVPTNENLPALISRALQRDNMNVVPQWSQVRHLPGYLQNQIRRLGRDVFRNFTDTPLESLQILTTVISDDTEVRGLMGWIQRNGVQDRSVEMVFGGNGQNPGNQPRRPGGNQRQQIQIAAGQGGPGGGVRADVTLWHTEGFSFLLVRDYSGHHVYGWAGGRGVHLERDDRARLAQAPAPEPDEDEPPAMRM